MLKKTLLIAATIVTSITNFGYVCSSIPKNIPTDLTYLGKPIDALCFFVSESPIINLQKCGIINQRYKIKRINNHLQKKGFIGFDWENPDTNFHAEGYSYYQYFPAKDHSYWIYSINNGGGSGEFTTIYQVKRRDATTLSIKSLIGGDRCNGGLSNVKDINHHLIMDINLTPHDLIAIDPGSTKHIKAYEDLAACAICCVAKARLELNNDDQLIMKYVVFNEIANVNELPKQGTYQACFNQLFIASLKNHKDHFTQAEVKHFAEKFVKVCVIN